MLTKTVTEHGKSGTDKEEEEKEETKKKKYLDPKQLFPHDYFYTNFLIKNKSQIAVQK